MFTDDEKDYLMRIIKEVARVLASVMLGKKYVQVELPVESKYQISGDKLHHLKTMVDNGEINEAENELLDRIDYSEQGRPGRSHVFYEYAAPKGMNSWKPTTTLWKRLRVACSSWPRTLAMATL